MSNLDQLESQRLQLEESVAKLRKSLQHWRTWDAEYEGLKEELQTSGDAESEEDCARLSEQLGGELVNKQEICELFAISKGHLRSNNQVSGLIDRRQDYVQQNINSISKQIRAAEDRLVQVIEEQDHGDEHRTFELPLTEILEELDDEGNVISTKVSQPEDSTAQILETLRKAGLTDMETGTQTTQSSSIGADSAKPAETASSVKGKQQAASDDISSPEADLSKGTKKSVKFADDVHVQEFANPPKKSTAKDSAVAVPNPSLISGSFDSNERVIELDDDDETIGMTPVNHEDESPEDARLRREMLQYSLNEVGSVVAELELEEDYSDDEDDGDFDVEEIASLNSEMSEDEDDHGRSLRKGVTPKYRQQMLELEEKLMARMLENVGPEPDEDNPDIDPEELRRLVIREDSEMPSAKAKESSTKKGVRFADDLDISEAPSGEQNAVPPATKKPAAVADTVSERHTPIIEDILERKAPTAGPATKDEENPAKVSRFKQNRKVGQSPVPLPESQVSGQLEDKVSVDVREENRPILSKSVVERPATLAAAPTPHADELDPEIQQRQLASEYYRMRNNMVRQQGGFKVTEEDLERPLLEERDGKVKKVSRFKAARLR
ncbi:Prefoldin subunit-domain-containing protein [Delphinella strobiligena]|nr:Prefoldin subunit-domain-containing protein [Delphinella strobiligena]